MMNIEVDAQAVINNLLEQNKQLTLEIAILQAQLSQPQQEQQSSDQES